MLWHSCINIAADCLNSFRFLISITLSSVRLTQTCLTWLLVRHYEDSAKTNRVNFWYFWAYLTAFSCFLFFCFLFLCDLPLICAYRVRLLANLRVLTSGFCMISCRILGLWRSVNFGLLGLFGSASSGCSIS